MEARMCLSFNMDWQILLNFIPQSMLKLPTHSGFHDLFLKYTYCIIKNSELATTYEYLLLLGKILTFAGFFAPVLPKS